MGSIPRYFHSFIRQVFTGGLHLPGSVLGAGDTAVNETAEVSAPRREQASAVSSGGKYSGRKEYEEAGRGGRGAGKASQSRQRQG